MRWKLPATAILAILAAAGLLLEGRMASAALLPVPFILYSRVRGEEILDNFVRGKIYGYITANPGESLNSIRHGLGIPHGTCVYHLRRLEGEELVKSRQDGPARRYFPAGMTVPESYPGMLSAVERSVIGMVKERPGISQKEMAEALRVSGVAVNNHVRALMEKGVLRRVRTGMRFRYFAAGAGAGVRPESRSPGPQADAADSAAI